MAKKFLENVKVLSNEQLASCIWKIELEAPATSSATLQGQFVHMQVDGGKKFMLRRPFSVFRADAKNNRIEVVYEIKGKGTSLMTAFEIGDTLSLIAPCGNSWLSTLDSSASDRIKKALFVGGGVGAAPLYMLAKNLVDRGAVVDVVLGARTKELLVLENDYKQLNVRELVCATDDGTYGESGFCTIPACRLLEVNDYDYVATCGPVPVMKKVADASLQKGIPAEVSMEERMACGVGACKTCVVNTVNGKVKACDCGPVFGAEVITW